MDIKQLLTIGKTQSIVKVKLPTGETVDIHLETPPIGDLKTDLGAYGTVAQYVVKVGTDEYRTPEAKKVLADVFSQMQVSAFSNLVDACNALNKVQEETTKEIFSGKV